MANDQSRREFLGQVTHTAVAVAAGLAAARRAEAGPAGGARGAADAPVEALSRVFTAPPDAAKPMTRWWWFGGAVTPAEITRELTFMRDAGLRGAEIQPVYPVTVDDPAHGIRHHRYYSTEWYDLLRHASREARRLGLQLDLTLGSGWPYGGPFVPPELGRAPPSSRFHRRRRAARLLVGRTRRSSARATAPAALVLAPVADDGSARTDGARVLEHARRQVAARRGRSHRGAGG